VLGFLLVPSFRHRGRGDLLARRAVFLTFWFVNRRLVYKLPVLELLGMLVAAIGCALVVRLLLSQMHQIPGLLLAIPVVWNDVVM
jgi:hypothetical protein